MDLIEAGADLNSVNNCGNTALIFAAQYGHQTIAERLIRAGANPKVVNAEGMTAEEYAREKGYKEIVRLLN